MTTYVAEVNIPISCHLSPHRRYELENPTHFGVKRAYWRLGLRPDEVGNDRPAGIDVVIELTADSTEQAEDNTLSAGTALSHYFSVLIGQPLPAPRLSRLAEIGSARGIIEQRNYYYEERRHSLPTAPIIPWKFDALLRRSTSTCRKTRESLELAMRWYSIALGADDPIDAYLSIWIGLEALSKALAKRYHPEGYKKACQRCFVISRSIKNARDIDDLLSINHLIDNIAPELLENQSIVELKNLRHFIVHPDKVIREDRAIDEIRREIEPLVQDMQLCLAVAILNVVNPPTENPGSVTLWNIPKVKIHPDSMVWLCSDIELTCYDPWDGNWIDMKRDETLLSSEIDKNGLYSTQWESDLSIPVESRMPHPNVKRGQVVFKRGLEMTDPRGIAPEYREWRPIKVSAAWKRMM